MSEEVQVYRLITRSFFSASSSTMIDFLDIIYCHNFHLKACFGGLNLSPSTGKESAPLGPINKACSCLQTPEALQDIILNTNTTKIIPQS